MLGTNYNSIEMNNYLDTMFTDPNADHRKTAIINDQKLMAKDVPCIPLFTMANQTVVYQKGITGIVLETSENIHYNSITVTEKTTTVTTESSSTIETTPNFELIITIVVLISTGVIYRSKKNS